MREVKLGSVCEIKNGYAFKSSEFKDSGTPLIRISSFDNGPVFFDEGTAYVDSEYLESKSAFRVERGDVLIALSGATTGKYGIYTHDEPSLLNQRIGLLKSGASKELDDKFFYYYLSVLQSEILRKAGGAAQPNISTKAISEFDIPLPPLEQQKKIAAILDAADEYRQKTKALIAKYDELTQSLFLDMFGDPVTNPKGWTKKPMGEIMTIVRGGSPRPINDFLGGTNPWIKIGDATKGDDLYLHRTKEHITDAGLGKTRLLPEGSLIFANCGVSLGFARIIKIQGCIHDGWLAFSDFDENVLNKIFLLKSLNSVTKYFRDTAPDGTQPNLNTAIMKKYEIILPPIELQNKFVKSLMSIYDQKSQAEIAFSKAEELFNSLLQKAFKGELI